MHSKILTLKESTEWESLVNELPPHLQDVYAMPGFYKLFESTNAGVAHCFVYRDGGDMAIYPFMSNTVNDLGFDLPETYYDIQAPYGYNGIYATTTTPSFLSCFAREFERFCAHSNIIAEMIRFNPVLQNETSARHAEIFHVLDNVGIDLSEGYEKVWSHGFKKSVRSAVRKAETFNLQFEYFLSSDLPPNWLDEFIKIYISTMQRNTASDYYYFDKQFFVQLMSNLPKRSLFAFVLDNDRPISSEIVLFNGEVSYSYLAGTYSETYPKKPNTWLCHKLLPVLIDMGMKYYSIGGGLSQNDSLYKYKKSFSVNSVDLPIYIGKKIHNRTIYSEVVEQWKNKYPQLEHKYEPYVLKYRYKT